MKSSTNENKTKSLNDLLDKHYGKEGTKKRDAFEVKANLAIMGETIKRLRKERGMSQTDLGNVIGLQKAQISKIENGVAGTSLDNIVMIFKVLGAIKVKFQYELELDSQETLELA